ncbi:hypothetical protein FDENT_646 [Fusarium denticulatum]|uniref:Uncharacterized protein n=1 Tax=Fusarium denticulatum TaxID=48507 RepID=A0A8H5XKF8_9HYPO|nr:hypothetical protein FDENT_646 [Fusarium denticulatum]
MPDYLVKVSQLAAGLPRSDGPTRIVSHSATSKWPTDRCMSLIVLPRKSRVSRSDFRFAASDSAISIYPETSIGQELMTCSQDPKQQGYPDCKLYAFGEQPPSSHDHEGVAMERPTEIGKVILVEASQYESPSHLQPGCTFQCFHVIAQIIDDCVEGHRETITPDYVVEHKYNVTYMAKVEIDDPFVEPDPFTETDFEAKEACLVRESALESELAMCKAAAAASGAGSSHSSCAQCGIIGKNDPGHFPRRLKTDLAACKAGCAAVGDGTTCRSYAHDGGSPGTCLLYYKHIRELEPAGDFKVEGAWRSWDKEC